MAKVVVSLLTAILVLNALTFLFVVSLEGTPGGTAPQGSQGASKAAIDALGERLQSIATSVQSLRSSVDNTSRQLSSKLDSVPQRVAADVRRALPPASAPMTEGETPSPGGATRNPPVPARRTGTTDFSQVPPEPTEEGAGAEGVEELPAPSGVENGGEGVTEPPGE